MSAQLHPHSLGSAPSLPSPDEALERFFVSHRWASVASEEIALEAGCTRVLADDFAAPYAVPSRPHAAVDGYALRFADLHDGLTLRCSSKLRIGKLALQSVRRGEAVRVSAGTVLPPGSDVVIPVEATDEASGTLQVLGQIARWANIVPIGAELRAKQVLLHSGSVLTAGDLGVLASFGAISVRVRRRPTIALITFGDHLAPAGDASLPGQTYDVSRYVIGATLNAWGAKVVPLSARRGDNLVAMLQMAMQHAEAVVIAEDTDGDVAGGKSKVAPAIEQMQRGGTLVEGVRMMPGAATVLAAVGSSPVIGLTGSSTGALLSLLVLGEPIVRQIVGRNEKAPTTTHTAENAIRGKRGWDCLIPVRTQNQTCSPFPKAAGHQSTLTQAGGFVRVPPQVGQYQIGSTVAVEHFPC